MSRASDARNRYKIRYTRNQDRLASLQVKAHDRVFGTHRGPVGYEVAVGLEPVGPEVLVLVGVVAHGLFGAVTEHGFDHCDHLVASHTAGFGQLVRGGVGGCVYDRLAALRVGVEPLGQDAAGAGGAVRPRGVARIDDVAEILGHGPLGPCAQKPSHGSAGLRMRG